MSPQTRQNQLINSTPLGFVSPGFVSPCFLEVYLCLVLLPTPQIQDCLPGPVGGSGISDGAHTCHLAGHCTSPPVAAIVCAGGGEKQPCAPPPPCFPTAPRASLVKQTYIRIKANGGDTSPQPPVTFLGQVLHQHLGKTLGGLGESVWV